MGLIGNLVLTWSLGLLPALVARYIWRRAPLASKPATLIALATCLIFGTCFMVVRSSYGGSERIGLVWILIFFVSRAIMRSGYKAQVISKLRALIDDPNSDRSRVAWAHEQLARLKADATPQKTSKLASGPDMPRPLPQRQQRTRAAHYAGRLGKPAAIALGALALTNFFLLLSGQRVLVGETIVRAGQSYEWSDWVIGHDRRDVLMCRYWSGRSVQPNTSWYGIESGQMSECPILSSTQETWQN